jgi:hypothetical protein
MSIDTLKSHERSRDRRIIEQSLTPEKAAAYEEVASRVEGVTTQRLEASQVTTLSKAAAEYAGTQGNVLFRINAASPEALAQFHAELKAIEAPIPNPETDPVEAVGRIEKGETPAVDPETSEEMSGIALGNLAGVEEPDPDESEK